MPPPPPLPPPPPPPMEGILVLVLYGVGRAEFWVLCIIRINIILNIIRMKYYGTLEQAAGLRDIVGPTAEPCTACGKIISRKFPGNIRVLCRNRFLAI